MKGHRCIIAKNDSDAGEIYVINSADPRWSDLIENARVFPSTRKAKEYINWHGLSGGRIKLLFPKD
jgi:hypothetical protein